MKFEIDMDDDFQRIFITAGATEAQCRCGRTHTAMLSYEDWEDNQDIIDGILDSMQEQAKKDNMMVLNYEVDSIELIEIGPVTYVANCECEGWRLYMNLLINQRRQIAEFLVATSKEIKRVQAYEDVMDVLADEYERPGVDTRGHA